MELMIRMNSGKSYRYEVDHSNFSEACRDLTIGSGSDIIFIEDDVCLNWKNISSIEEICSQNVQEANK